MGVLCSLCGETVVLYLCILLESEQYYVGWGGKIFPLLCWGHVPLFHGRKSDINHYFRSSFCRTAFFPPQLGTFKVCQLGSFLKRFQNRLKLLYFHKLFLFFLFPYFISIVCNPVFVRCAFLTIIRSMYLIRIYENMHSAF